jgi:putative polyhydroxyalkanoate system protein
MPDICITQAHVLTQKKARAAAQEVADQITREFDMAAEWDGDVLLFRRTGVSGQLVLADRQAQIEINLGFLFKAFAPTIQHKVASKMGTVFLAEASGAA